MNELEGKLCKLKDILAGIGSVLIAYSGGADSTFLLKVALDVLGENVLAATTRAPIFPSSELTAAAEMAHRLGARHLFVEAGVLDDPSFSCNPPARVLFLQAGAFLKAEGIGQQAWPERSYRGVQSG